MARYIVLGKLTHEGAMTLSISATEGAKRLAKAQGYFEKLGVKILDFYATIGPYDYVAVIDAPEDLTTMFKAATFAAAFGATFGSVTWTPMPAMPYQEFVKAVEDFPPI